jgi:chromate transporter
MSASSAAWAKAVFGTGTMRFCLRASWRRRWRPSSPSCPAFLFILVRRAAGRGHARHIKFTAPLTGITAAVVGVIVNLAVFFAWHTFWPQGTATAPFGGPSSGVAVLIAIAAFLALWKYKQDIMKVIGMCALLGLALSFIR